jgi:hypothetical protein
LSFEKFFDSPQVDSTAAKEKFIAHLDELKSMDVREQTLYQKWYELHTDYNWAYNKASILKAKVWRPTDITNRVMTLTELDNLRPILRFIPPTDKKGIEDWTLYRVFVSSFNFDQNPGRFLRFFLEDEVTGQILGITSLGSDVVNIGCRDNWIGWTKEQKLEGMLNHTAIGTTIVATQPFGFNFLGGKLLASMLVTPLIRDTWKREYGETLAGITTTSLYGDGSMYNSIPWWKSLGETMGKIPLKPTDDHYKVWHDIIKVKYPDQYQELLWNDNGGPATGVKQKILNIIFKEVGVKPSQYLHGFSRGVYFAPLYENTKEYLRKEVSDEQLIPLKRDTSHDAVLTWWRKKAVSRYESLIKDNRLKPESLFYNDVIFQTWEETKAKYLGEVGR